MSKDNELFEYCTIQSQIIDDLRDPGRGGHKVMWLQFAARAQNEQGNYIVDRSEKIPLANMLGAESYGPKKSNVGHTNTLNNFVAKLQKAGWMLEGDGSGEWWQKRLKRVSQPKESLFDRLKAKLNR